MQVALENAIGIEAVAIASDMAVKIALLQGLTQRHVIERSDVHLEAHAGPHLLDDLGALAIVGQVGKTDQLDRRPHGAGLP